MEQHVQTATEELNPHIQGEGPHASNKQSRKNDWLHNGLQRSPRHGHTIVTHPNILEESGSGNANQQPHESGENHTASASQIGYNTTNRRRIQATKPKNMKGRGGNKTKVHKDTIFVEVNEFGQPIGDAERPLSSLIGCLARDPRRLPFDVWDRRYLSQAKKDAVWEEVKQSYTFAEGQEPYDWAMKTMNAAWRLEKSELKIAHFDGRTHNDALAQRSEVSHIPEDMWRNLVEFWGSSKGQDRSSRNKINRSKLTMCHYAGTKSFARIRAEKKKKDGKEPDPLDMWLDTHQPKQGSQLDKASAATKKSIEEELTSLPVDSNNDEERMKIFRKYVGEDKNGYAKTFGLGVKVPRSHAKRCASEEERARRIESEKKVEKMEKKLDKVTTLMRRFLQLQGMSYDICLSEEEEHDDDGGDGEGTCYEKYSEENLENENMGNEIEEVRSYQAQYQDDYLESEQTM